MKRESKERHSKWKEILEESEKKFDTGHEALHVSFNKLCPAQSSLGAEVEEMEYALHMVHGKIIGHLTFTKLQKTSEEFDNPENENLRLWFEVFRREQKQPRNQSFGMKVANGICIADVNSNVGSPASKVKKNSSCRGSLDLMKY